MLEAVAGQGRHRVACELQMRLPGPFVIGQARDIL